MGATKKRSPAHRVLRIALPVVLVSAIVIFLGKNWQQEWYELARQQFRLNPWLLALAFAGFIVQELSYGLIWRSVLQRLDYPLNLRVCLRIYLASEFVRYIPGNVWHVLTRTLWTAKYGVPRSIAFASMTIELTTKLAAGVFIFALSLLFWGNLSAISGLANGAYTPVLIGLGLFCMLTLLIGLHPRILNGLLSLGLRLLKRSPVQLLLRYRDILVVTLAWCASWVIAGGAFFLLIAALWPSTPLILLPICIGIYALAWDIGFVSFITPGGLGFREGAITAILALAFPVLPLGLVGIGAILSRLVSTGAELVCVGGAYMSGGQQIRALQKQREVSSSAEKQPLELADSSFMDEVLTAPPSKKVQDG